MITASGAISSVRPPQYSPTRSRISLYLPAAWVPFIELTRLDKPVGFLYLYFPCLASTLVAALVAKPTTSLGNLSIVNILLFFSSVAMRGAGCSWNDTLDQELDRKVTRTRLRPIARGAVSSFAAHVCTSLQLLIFFGLQTQLPTPMSKTACTSCVYYSIPFIFATGLYPLAKRFTNYPQVFLSIPSSWGVFVAFPALGLDVFSSSTLIIAAGSLCLSNVAWTVLYDTIYAFQDLRDDIKTGIKSIAVRHEKDAKIILSMLSVAQIGFLLITNIVIEAGFVCFFGMFVTMATLGIMISQVDLQRPVDCAWWFKHGCVFVGGSTISGFLGEYLWRTKGSL